MAKAAQPQQLISPQSLIRGPTSSWTPSGPPPVQYTAAAIERLKRESAQQALEQANRNRGAVGSGYGPINQPQYSWQQPQHFPQQQQFHHQVPAQQMMPVNYQMPSYLSVPETIRPGEGMFAPLMRSLFRSAGKSVGHSLAHFFDWTPASRGDGGPGDK
jgi:hypothetical protein